MSNKPKNFDLEEIAPNKFMIYTVQTKQFLKSEGTIDGRLFELTSWRREGLLARLRTRGFKVATLPEQIQQLPTPPTPPTIGKVGWRTLSTSIEQFSQFDWSKLSWQALTPELQQGLYGVYIEAGRVLRRRKGRGAASYYLALAEHTNTIGLRALEEEQAILLGYAQANVLDARPIFALQQGEGRLIPRVELPNSHEAMLQRLSKKQQDGWLVNPDAWDLVVQIFDRLGVELLVQDSPVGESAEA